MDSNATGSAGHPAVSIAGPAALLAAPLTGLPNAVPSPHTPDHATHHSYTSSARPVFVFERAHHRPVTVRSLRALRDVRNSTSFNPNTGALLVLDPHHFRAALGLTSDAGSTATCPEPSGQAEILAVELQPWRVRDRMKTVAVALVLCLNIGVDPPDMVKPDPCARLECWLDPSNLGGSNAANETVSKALQLQYERWSPRARYKVATDPTADELRKHLTHLRRHAKDDRVLFHYNGHGVPKATENGEIWVFNKTYTQYIPVSVVDISNWIGRPSIYVFDCSSAGFLIRQYVKRVGNGVPTSASTNDTVPGPGASDNTTASGMQSSPTGDAILLAACQGNEYLPTNPDLPADLFTSCLTTPIKMALRWFAPRSLVEGITPQMLDKIPGRLNDRKTPLGELNWIFTAITDTIAWNALPRPLFKRLFRQDLLVASLFRNYLLAERILWNCKCTPVSEPALPSTHNHPLWQAWDFTVEHCLAQLPTLLAAEEELSKRSSVTSVVSSRGGANSRQTDISVSPRETVYESNPFFEDQMTAFEVWLSVGPRDKTPPEQLPIVLQVLLSQAHRLRALKLLARFLQIGSWAIDLALSVGIFPYILKLLQSPASELRQELVFIWGKILAMDRTCEVDLLKENGHLYFVEFLMAGTAPPVHLCMAAFVLSSVCTAAPEKCHESGVLQATVTRLGDRAPLVRRWVLFCMASLTKASSGVFFELWRKDSGGLSQSVTRFVASMAVKDTAPDVRCAATHLLGVLLARAFGFLLDKGESDGDWIEELLMMVAPEAKLLVETLAQVAATDGCPLVRREVVSALGTSLTGDVAVLRRLLEDKDNVSEPEEILLDAWCLLNRLTEDVHPVVRGTAYLFTEQLRPNTNRHAACEGGHDQTADRSGNRTIEKTNPVIRALNRLALLKRELPVLLNSAASVVTSAVPEIPVSVKGDDYRFDDMRMAAEAKSLQEWKHEEILRLQCDTIREGEDQEARMESTLLGKQVFRRGLSRMHQTLKGDWDLLHLREKSTDDWLKSMREAVSLQLDGGIVCSSCFYPNEPLIAVGDDQGRISTWNYEAGRCTTGFKFPLPHKQISGISSIHILESGESLSLVAANWDGVASFWNVSRDGNSGELKTVWRASGQDERDSINGPFGMQMIWESDREQFVVGGCELGVVRVWDIRQEKCSWSGDVLRNDGVVTALGGVSATADSGTHGPDTVIVAGSNGAVWHVDRRAPDRGASLVATHRSPVCAVTHQLILGPHHFSSAEMDGVVKAWDLRCGPTRALTELTVCNRGLTAMAASLGGSTLAVASVVPAVHFVQMSSAKEIGVLQYHDGFLGTHFQLATTLSWHPKRSLLSIGFIDSSLAIFR